MKDYKNLLFEVSNGVGILTMNRPEALNALNKETMDELMDCFHDVEADAAVKVLIVTGAEKAFIAGADIKEMLPMTALEAQKWSRLGQSVFNAIDQLSKPVIAAVNGFALGGGCELAMACDIRIASSKAKFGQPEVSLGIIPGFAGTQRLARLVGEGIAKELIFTGDMIDAQEAWRIGLVNKVVEANELLPTAVMFAEKIIQKSQCAIKLAKLAIHNGLNTDVETGSQYEAALFGVACSTDDKHEGMTAFIEKRKAVFVGK